MRRRSGTALLASIISGGLAWGLAAPAHAQTTDPAARHWSISAVLGAGGTWDDEGGLGSGVLAGVRAGLSLGRGHELEVGGSLLDHDRQGTFQAHGRTVFGEVTYLRRFGRATVRPYVLAGLVVAHHTGTAGFPAVGQVYSTRSTDPGLQGGGGVMVRLARGVEIGPEARVILLRAGTGAAPASALTGGVRLTFGGGRSGTPSR